MEPLQVIACGCASPRDGREDAIDHFPYGDCPAKRGARCRWLRRCLSPE
jgi:hypothetical protein